MESMTRFLTLADWRRRTAEMYAAVRRQGASNPEQSWQQFRRQREQLFKEHPQSPLDAGQQACFRHLDYFPYDPAWRLSGRLDWDVEPMLLSLDLGEDGLFRYRRIARVQFTAQGREAHLSLFWVLGYGGGLFLPFRDSSNGQETFGAGRYLYDTLKGADLGAGSERLLLDFNYAYNPSCAYHARWVCPLPPAENRLPFAVTAGEKRFV